MIGQLWRGWSRKKIASLRCDLVVSCRVSELMAFALKTLTPWASAGWPNLQYKSEVASNQLQLTRFAKTYFGQATELQVKERDVRGPLSLLLIWWLN